MSINSLDLMSDEWCKSESSIRYTEYVCANLPSTVQLSSGSHDILWSWVSSLARSLICCLPNLSAIKLSVKQECQKLSTFNSLLVKVILSWNVMMDSGDGWSYDLQILYEKCINFVFHS